MAGLAVSLGPSGLSFAENIAFAKEAEQLGYDSAWVPEVGGNDAFALGAAVGAATERMRIGTAVVPMNIRGPALLAMAASTMDAMSGGGRGICRSEERRVGKGWRARGWRGELVRHEQM